MPYAGDLTIDAGRSDFDFEHMTCYDSNGGEMSDVDTDANALTLIDVPANTDYDCTFEGADGVTTGTFAVTIMCTSDAPTRSPTSNPTDEPTDEPTSNPTEEPTADPTKEPTASPTKDPTEEPSASPTTPAPTHPGELSCGDRISGKYNGKSVDFEVRMPYAGDMTVNAEGSDFDFEHMTCYDSDGNEMTDVDAAA